MNYFVKTFFLNMNTNYKMVSKKKISRLKKRQEQLARMHDVRF